MENITADQARQQLDPQKNSEAQKKQYRIIEKNIKYIYKEINRALSKNNDEVEISLGYYGGILIYDSHWFNSFDLLTDESRRIILDYFRSKGFISYFHGFGAFSDPYMTIGWKKKEDSSSEWYGEVHNKYSLNEYLKYIGEKTI